jgi:hypothetical protein
MNYVKTIRKWRKENASILPRHRTRPVSFGSREWRYECGDKISYWTLESAMRAFNEIWPKSHIHATNLNPLTIYTCGWCDCLHIGHHPPTMDFSTVIYARDYSQLGTPETSASVRAAQQAQPDCGAIG